MLMKRRDGNVTMDQDDSIFQNQELRLKYEAGTLRRFQTSAKKKQSRDFDNNIDSHEANQLALDKLQKRKQKKLFSQNLSQQRVPIL